MKTYFHGECVVTKIDKIPNNAKRFKPEEGKYIVAASETTFNHHCIEDIEGVEMYEKDGVLFLKNNLPVKIFCVDETRHDTEVLEPGIWEIKRANEYDYLKEMNRKVQD